MNKTLLFLEIILLCACVDEGSIPASERNTWSHFDLADGLVSDQITALYEDEEGNIWIGTSEGLSIYNGASFINYTTLDGLNSDYINCFVQDKDGDVWIGSSNGVNYIRNGVVNSLFSSDIVVYSLIELFNKDIVFGTDGLGTILYSFSDNDVFTFYYDDACTGCNIAYALVEDNQNAVWIGTEVGVKRIKGNSLTSISAAEGLSGDVVVSLCEDDWGNIWAGTYDGRTVSRITGGQAEEINLTNSFSQNWIWSIETDHKGVVWISTAIAGLYRYDGAMMRKDFDHLPDDNVSALLKDSHGNMWVGTLFNGLYKYTP